LNSGSARMSLISASFIVDWVEWIWVDAIIIWLCKKNNNITYIYNKLLQ